LSTIEVPVLKLGIAGFSAEQEAGIRRAAAASRITRWICGPMAGADAWLVNGQRTQHLGGGRVRVAPREAGERSLQLQLETAQRPVGFSAPVPAGVQDACTFDLADPQSIVEAIGLFEFVLAPRASQYLLASEIVQQQDVLGTGAFEVRAKGQLIAAVDMRGEAAVLPSVRPSNFESAVWTRVDRNRLRLPDNFCRTSLSELMWRYVSRSGRDLLPQRYRTGPIFFRRAPRVDPVLVEEPHLLVLRELAIVPGTFDELQQRTRIPEADLGRALAALYYVGSITSTRGRAAPSTVDEVQRSRSASCYGELRGHLLELADLRQLTAPAPLSLLT
jgi:hypothetical protein